MHPGVNKRKAFYGFVMILSAGASLGVFILGKLGSPGTGWGFFLIARSSHAP